TRIDDEEQIALVDDLPLLEMVRLQIAADPRAQLDIFDRGELTGELVILDNLALKRLRDRDNRRSRLCLRVSGPCQKQRDTASRERKTPQRVGGWSRRVAYWNRHVTPPRADA